MSWRSSGPLWAIGCAVGGLLMLGPLLGWPAVVRLNAVVVATALLVAGLGYDRLDTIEASIDRSPGGWMVGVAVLTGLVLYWVVLTRFYSGEINAIDFTVYFDRPCFQMVNGRPWFVETADAAEFSARSILYHHPYWAMLPICSLYALYPTPLWLHAVSVLAVVLGALYVFRVVQTIGAGVALAAAAALAFVLNEHTSGTLNYGFHPEVLYAWFIPWAIYAALWNRHGQFLVAVLCTVLVKEAAVLPLLAVSTAVGLNRWRQITARERALYLLLPVALATLNLALFLGFVAPAYSPDGRPAYAGFWQSYGPSPLSAVVGMATHPSRVLAGALNSPFFTRMLPTLLWLPVIGWRWTIGVLPIVVIFSASDSPQIQAFGLYYPIAFVPFLVIGGAAGALKVASRLPAFVSRPSLAAAALLIPFTVSGGFDGGYSLRPWSTQIRSVADALSSLSHEPVVLVQSSLYPHAGYDARIKLLAGHTIRDPRHIGAAVLIGTGLGSYPLSEEDLAQLECLPPISGMPGGLRAVRLEAPGRVACPSSHLARD